MRLIVLAAILVGGLMASACTSMARPLPTQSAEQATRAFLEAFNSLDPARFDSFFAEDVTMFFPNGPFPKERVEGKAAVTGAFARFFGMAKQRGATRLGIEPLDLAVQNHGGFAVATFHLRGGNGNIGRRSILLGLQEGHWRIVHFHASALEADK
ncbi:MAG TPA: nuclear transport factor 2 family protein [Allosphingosinicella sp.]|nr:nuclear transport factor 2 family protein [Allosphingosinicella sp.]